MASFRRSCVRPDWFVLPMCRFCRLQTGGGRRRQHFDDEVEPLIHLRPLSRMQRNARAVGLDDRRAFDDVSAGELLELERIGIVETAEVLPPHLPAPEMRGRGGRAFPLRTE